MSTLDGHSFKRFIRGIVTTFSYFLLKSVKLQHMVLLIFLFYIQFFAINKTDCESDVSATVYPDAQAGEVEVA